VLCRFSRQVAAFFKKNKAFAERDVCYEAAHQSFTKAEVLCRITNKRLDYFYTHQERMDAQLRKWISSAEDSVKTVLGDIGVFYQDLPGLVRVTSGATATRSRRKSLPYLKVRMRRLPATRTAIPYLRALSRFYGFKRVSFDVVIHNRVETVPKNWKTDRTIACEPEGNLFLQLAFDGFAKDRLRKFGIDLSDQSENQYLARKGAESGDFATIDLSMASDTVSRNAVAWLFPSDWNSFLNDVRSPFGHGFGREWEYAKLSSMGNGATFAVETLIFAALSRAVGSRDHRVYGDDIVIRKEFVADLLRLLKFFGFRVNESKSFFTGPFRESCGADWFNSSNVTPFYLRPESETKVELCHIVNSCVPLTFPGGRLAEYLTNLVRSAKLPYIPWNGSSISGVWVSPHHAYDLKLIVSRHQVSYVRAFTPRTRKLRVWDSRSLFLWHLDAFRRAAGHKLYEEFNPYFSRFLPGLERVDEMQTIIRSEVPIFSHKYVRKWVCWLPPAVATPLHLYWWGDLASPVKRSQESGQ
jgi:hypothetical protein